MMKKEELPKEDLQVLVTMMDEACRKGYYDAMDMEIVEMQKKLQEVEE